MQVPCGFLGPSWGPLGPSWVSHWAFVAVWAVSLGRRVALVAIVVQCASADAAYLTNICMMHTLISIKVVND
eukprot:373338-Pyramimonas_sp.AAC.1